MMKQKKLKPKPKKQKKKKVKKAQSHAHAIALRQLLQAKELLGLEGVRYHGLYDDDMSVVTR